MTIPAGEITGLVLAGGRGARMGHLDKGLQLLRGYPMVMHVLARLAPQVGPVLISANRNLEVYGSLGHRLVSDRLADFAGPLAGLEAGLASCETPYLLCVPCDAPFLPADLAERLGAALETEDASLAMACTEARPQPVFSLMHRRVQASLSAYLDAGGRKFEAWTASLPATLVPFDGQALAFRNINTPEELAASEGLPAFRAPPRPPAG